MTKLMILLSLILAFNTLVMVIAEYVLPKYVPAKAVLWKRIQWVTLILGLVISFYLALNSFGFIGAMF